MNKILNCNKFKINLELIFTYKFLHGKPILNRMLSIWNRYICFYYYLSFKVDIIKIHLQKKQKQKYEFACKEAKKKPQVTKTGDWLRGCMNYFCILASKMLGSKTEKRLKEIRRVKVGNEHYFDYLTRCRIFDVARIWFDWRIITIRTRLY